ncbi:hypothetical protein COU80_02615 [Candidatus Peregrinibacteria bacterium CG10_big_fil_rev_8_21_14_0_10_55_24]|nr:MAG: hypothetical protein COU80_02615 [Candidatus Peregrinibacteria bacterium CG10_big_fil_rev_8_21_14_0_10_55_24]
MDPLNLPDDENIFGPDGGLDSQLAGMPTGGTTVHEGPFDPYEEVHCLEARGQSVPPEIVEQARQEEWEVFND